MSLSTFFTGLFKTQLASIAEKEIENIGEKELEAGLNELHVSHPTEYAVGVPGTHLIFKLMKDKFAGSPITLEVLNAIDEAFVNSAATNGIVLEAPVAAVAPLDTPTDPTDKHGGEPGNG